VTKWELFCSWESSKLATPAMLSPLKATQLRVLSYCGLNGQIIVTAIIPGGNLHKVHGQTNPNRRPEGINYAIISCNIIFLLDTNPNDTQAYPFTFFICLPVEDISKVLSSTAQPVPLKTFYGPNNWAINPGTKP
jgi:hypothetical protein